MKNSIIFSIFEDHKPNKPNNIMKQTVVRLSAFFYLILTSNMSLHAQNIQYPTTQKGDVVDEYFGTKVADPYRWLEASDAPETRAWIDAQNQLTQNYLTAIPYREKIEERLSKLWNYEKVSAPYKRGEFYYFYKNDGLQNQAVLYRSQRIGGKAEVFLNPNKLSDNGTVSLGSTAFTKDGSLFAYSTSTGGSD